MRIVLPDPLIWEAGTEYALEALALLEAPFDGTLATEGPLLPAVAFAVHQLGLEGRVGFGRDLRAATATADLVLLPRVKAMDPAVITRCLERGRAVVVTSDPGLELVHPRLHRFGRRDVEELSRVVAGVLGAAPPGAA